MKRCRIVNPLPDGKSLIRRKAAERAVKAGFAVWSGPDTLVLLENAHNAADQHIIDAWLWKQKKVKEEELRKCLGYDRVQRPMRLEEIRNLPVVQAERLMQLTNKRALRPKSAGRKVSPSSPSPKRAVSPASPAS